MTNWDILGSGKVPTALNSQKISDWAKLGTKGYFLAIRLGPTEQAGSTISVVVLVLTLHNWCIAQIFFYYFALMKLCSKFSVKSLENKANKKDIDIHQKKMFNSVLEKCSNGVYYYLTTLLDIPLESCII